MAEKPGYLGNEKLLIITGCFSSLATRFANPQVVLPWVYNLIGGPLLLVGFLAPSFRLGGLLAQVSIVPGLLKLPTRKWAYVVATLISAAVLLMIASTLYGMAKTEALILFFLGLLLLGSCSGISGLTMTEVVAKTLPRDRIGHVLSWQMSVSGLTVLVVMSSLIYFDPDIKSGAHKALMIVMAAIASVCAALVFSLVREPPSKVEKTTSVWREITAGWGFLKRVQWFRRFVMVRTLFLSVGMATPFYSIHAATEFANTAHSLSMIVIATGVTSVFSAPIWSGILRRDSRKALFRSGIFAALAGVIVIVHESLGEPHPLVFMVVFAFLQLAVQGLTSAARTYLALKCPESDRPRYLAINNAVLGLVAIPVSGIIGILADSIHIYAALGLLIVFSVIAGIKALKLEDPNLGQESDA